VPVPNCTTEVRPLSIYARPSRREHPRVSRGYPRLLLALAFIVLVSCVPAGRSPTDEADPNGDIAALRLRAARADDLGWLRAELGGPSWPTGVVTRSDLVREKHRLRADGDPFGAASMSGILAAEGQIRAGRVLERWADRIDPETGLLPKGVDAADRLWDYADAGADLFPHLLIASHLLRSDAVAPLTAVIAAERRLGGSGLPGNVDLATDRSDPRPRDRMYGAVEYAKDGLLPLVERLGPGPWLDRLREIMLAVDAASAVNTRFGMIPSDESEINGQALQVYARLYWATGDDRYRASADRIARAYLDLALPNTGWVPTRTWDFARERPKSSVVQLRDHGNEVVAGLVEYHLIETALGLPSAADHRLRVRAMLDRLLAFGRDGHGMWRSAVDLETGESLKDTLSDNWGYLYAAYLAQALVEERWPGGDAAVAARYRAAAREGLAGAARLDLYPWQGDEQDGYADTVESALYLLDSLDAPEAARWTDRQAGTLFGAQADDGRVEDGYLDGNFVRTALLYASWQAGGVRLEPWSASATVGAVRDGDCLAVVVAGRGWQGRLVFDTPRHREHLGLPVDYPRLNAWPEWFVVEPGGSYRIDAPATGSTRTMAADELRDGLPLVIEAGREQRLSICPTDHRDPTSP
jgi:hypothetical protein